MYSIVARLVCLMLLMHFVCRARSRAAVVAGIAMAISMPIMEMTTSNSTSVFCSLPLTIVEVSWHCDHSILHLLSKLGLSDLLHLAENQISLFNILIILLMEFILQWRKMMKEL